MARQPTAKRGPGRPRRERPEDIPEPPAVVPGPPRAPVPLPPTFPGLKTVDVEIRGITPMLQHRFTEAAENARATRPRHQAPEDPRVAAEKRCYRWTDNTLYHPSSAISRLLREAGNAHKQRSSRRTVKYIVPAACIMPDEILILRDGEGRVLENFEVDSRPVVIPATKGRIMCHRPRHNNWSVRFAIEIDETILEESFVHQLMVEGGSQLGIGDFRVEKGGSFGRFRVTSWQPRKDNGNGAAAAA